MNYDNVYNDAEGLSIYHGIFIDDAIKIIIEARQNKFKFYSRYSRTMAQKISIKKKKEIMREEIMKGHEIDFNRIKENSSHKNLFTKIFKKYMPSKKDKDTFLKEGKNRQNIKMKPKTKKPKIKPKGQRARK